MAFSSRNQKIECTLGNVALRGPNPCKVALNVLLTLMCDERKSFVQSGTSLEKREGRLCVLDEGAGELLISFEAAADATSPIGPRLAGVGL